ncbi:hypothetical protein EPUS_08048 [Endocarpon pusillum Z07020]|uniref:Mediator of RNA polymerase II transcription subunit 10 n=1 Tax=Endocarpon pusillum (strain Z07020 / HMAS-L-300199) TaxID=1263415 RepID=U1GRJ7_ENDPU|nr:uncharacterized protein EPUS_08048 [Endocarpon pusillum Z07020]ERF75003.1 hypothetical protein EPUS_08048 [Endocarpon pusillum Z07020]
MARGRKWGTAATAARNRERDGDFDPPPPKRGPPKKPTSTSPRKGRKAQQHNTVDEGVAATPDDTGSQAQAQAQNDDSTYDSSPRNETSQTTPLATLARQNAARSTRNNKNFLDPSSGGLVAEQASSSYAGPSSNTQSKVVVLKVPAHKLREIVEAHAAPERKVTLKVSPEKLRKLLQETGEGNLESEAAKQPETPQGGESAGMAPVKDKNPHDVLDGESILTKEDFYQYHDIDHTGPDHFKNVIQNLYDIGSITHGYLPESHDPLFNKNIDFVRSLAALSNLTADNSTHPAAPTIREILIPPEVIDYVANGRNPDIYTREFVENVQRGNQVLNGKMQAFGTFAELYARETKSAIPELAPAMDRLMEHSGGYERENGTGDWKMKKTQANGS